MKDQGEVYSVVNVIGYQLQSPACSCGPGVHTRTAENSARSHAGLYGEVGAPHLQDMGIWSNCTGSWWKRAS